MSTHKQSSFLKRNGLTLFMLFFGLLFLLAQFYTGWHEHNQQLHELRHSPIGFLTYLTSGHALQSTFENLESEFLQMAVFVVVTTFLFQKGSSESNPLPEEKKQEGEPLIHTHSPKAAKQKGFLKWLYSYSLSIILFSLFLLSFALHWYGSWKDFNLEQGICGEKTVSFFEYLANCRFWFESFQNWQSEFISIAAIVFLSIYFRHKGSSQSKPVNMPNEQTKG